MDKCKGCARKTFLARRFGTGFCGYDMAGETKCDFYISTESCKAGVLSSARDGAQAKANVKQLKVYATVGRS